MYAKSATTISNITEAAQTLFTSKNYADVTMSEIAETANMTKGALYHHFNSKEALYTAMMLADLAEKSELLGQAVTIQGSTRERLHHLVVSYLNLPHTKREVIRLVRRDVNIFKDPLRGQLIRAYQEALPQHVETIIEQGIEVGELAKTDPRLLSWTFVAMVEVLLNDYAQAAIGDSDRLADYVVDLFLNGAKVAEM